MYRYVIIFHLLFNFFTDIPRSQIPGNGFIASHRTTASDAFTGFIVTDI